MLALAMACSAAPSAPQDGTVSFSDGDAHGSVATFACKVGFAQTGDTTLTCAAPTADAAWPTAADAPKCTGNFKMALLSNLGLFCGALYHLILDEIWHA